ncbi:MAG: hypothetical protein ACP5UR_14000, partial [Chloroflexus sp.]
MNIVLSWVGSRRLQSHTDPTTSRTLRPSRPLFNGSGWVVGPEDDPTTSRTLRPSRPLFNGS